MANRGRFGKVHAVGGDNFDLLLGVDIDAHAATLMIGYGLEHYLTEHDLERALAGASGALHDRAYGRAIRICVELLTDRMKTVVKWLEESAPPAEQHHESS